MYLTQDLSRLDPALRESMLKQLAHEDRAQFVLAQIEQAKMAKFCRDHVAPGTTKDGVGPLRSIIHPGLKNYLAAKYGHATAWRDPDFMKWLTKRFDEFRVPDAGTKVQAGWGTK